MPTLSREALFTLVCGILSGSVFAFSSYNPDAGLLVMFLPLMPLALVGFSVSSRHCMGAALVACAMAGILAGVDYALFFVVIIVLPLLHFVRKALLWRGDEEQKQWYPLLPVLTELVMMTTVCIAGSILILGYSEHGELKTILAQIFHKLMDSQLEGSDPKYASIMKLLIDEWNFVVFSSISWLWVLMIYTFAAIANMFLRINDIALRPSLALGSRGLPLWLPFIIVIAAGLAVFGNSNDRYLGETIVLIMILPYFLSGAASFHEISQRFANRWIWIAVFYITLLLFPGLSVFVIAKGLHAQIEDLIKSPPTAKDY